MRWKAESLDERDELKKEDGALPLPLRGGAGSAAVMAAEATAPPPLLSAPLDMLGRSARSEDPIEIGIAALVSNWRWSGTAVLVRLARL